LIFTYKGTTFGLDYQLFLLLFYIFLIPNWGINYNGDVYKCTAREFDGTHKVGEIDSLGLLKRTSDAYLPESKFKDYCDSCMLLPICTICLQTHMENPNDACPKAISDEDMEIDIRNLF